jgi:hypothetical protein
MRVLVASLLLATCLSAQPLQPFLRVNGPKVALKHVRVIDGTGAPARTDQTILIDQGRIQAVGDAATVQIPDGAEVCWTFPAIP